MERSNTLRFWGIVAALIILIEPVHAGVTLYLGNYGQPNEEHVIFLPFYPDHTVSGYTAETGSPLQFGSRTDLMYATSRSQCCIVAVDGLINNMIVDAGDGHGGWFFSDLIFDVYGPTTQSFVVTVFLWSGTSVSFGVELRNAGDNFITIVDDNSTGFNPMYNVQIDPVDPAGGFRNFQQVMVSDIHAVPEPTSMLLIGSGVIGLAGMMRRKLS
jgi:PEP-CTERM motif